MPETRLLDDPFAPSTGTRPDPTVEGAGATIAQPDPAEVEANYRRLNERRAAGERAAVARHDAAIARQIAQAFSEYGRAFRKVADTKGSPVDHAVAVNLATYCEQQVDEYTAVQAHCATVADREGSV